MLSSAIRERSVVEQLTDLIDQDHASVTQLLRHGYLFRDCHVLQSVGVDQDSRSSAALCLSEQHLREDFTQLDGERLDRSIPERIHQIADCRVLQDALVYPEVVIDILLDDLHLLGVHCECGALDLLDIRVGVREQQDAVLTSGQVLRRESLAFLSKIRRLGEVVDPRHEPVCAGVLYSVLDALILNADQAHRVGQRSVALAEELGLVLVLCHDADIAQLVRSNIAGLEREPEPRHTVRLDKLVLARRNRGDADRLHEIVVHVDDKRRVPHVEDRVQPIQELRPCGCAVRRSLQPCAQFLLPVGLFNNHLQLADVA